MNRPETHRWRLLLIPFSWLYGFIVWFRNMLYDQELLGSTAFNIPIISVGNITVGGTGKTPHVEYLAELLNGDFRVAMLSRGYRRRTRDFRIATADSAVLEIGDEPMQVQQRFPGMTVAVDRKRVHGVRKLMEIEPPLEVILLDDAYQHRSLKPGFSILLIDFTRPIERDRLLPAGMLREPAVNRDRAQVILVTRSPERMKPIEMREYVKRLGLSLGQHLYFTSFRYGNLLPVFPGVEERDVPWFRERVSGVLILAGIANPRPLRQFARSIHTRISELYFSDHHRYTHRDMKRISGKYHAMKTEKEVEKEVEKEAGKEAKREPVKEPEDGKEVLILTTEKDAMRLRDLDPGPGLREAFHAVRIHVHFLNDDKSAFDQQIIDYVRSNKRSSILHQNKDGGVPGNSNHPGNGTGKDR